MASDDNIYDQTHPFVYKIQIPTVEKAFRNDRNEITQHTLNEKKEKVETCLNY